MVPKRRFFSVLGWVTGTSYSYFALNVAAQPILARCLTPDHFGIYGWLVSIRETTSVVIGIPVCIAVIVGDGTQEEFDAGWWLAAIVASAYTVTGLIGAGLLITLGRPTDAPLFAALSCATAAMTFSSVYLAPLQKQLAFRTVGLLQGVSAAVSITTGAILALFWPGPWCLVIREVLQALLVLVGAMWFSPMHFSRRVQYGILRRIAKTSLTMHMARASELLFLRVPQFAVGLLFGPQILGHLYQAQYLGSLPNSILGPLTETFALPAYSAIAENPGKSRASVYWSTCGLAHVLIPLGLVAAFAGNELVRTLLGGQWHMAGSFYQHLWLFMVVLPIFSNAKVFLYARLNQRYVTVAYMAASLVVLSGLVAAKTTAFIGFIPISLGLGILAAYAIVLFQASPTEFVRPSLEALWWPLLAAAISGALGFLLPVHGTILRAAVSVSCWAVLAFIPQRSALASLRAVYAGSKT